MTTSSKRTRFAPMDWIYSRPHGKVVAELGREFNNGEHDAALPTPAITAFTPFMKSTTEAATLAAIRYSISKLGDSAKPSTNMDVRWDAIAYTSVMSWCQRGRQVYRFTNSAVERLSATQTKDLTAGAIRRPNDTMYLAFDGADITLPNGLALDGVMVANRMMPPGTGREEHTKKVLSQLILEGTPRSQMLKEGLKRINNVPVLAIVLHPRGYALWPEKWVHGYTYEIELTNDNEPVLEALLRRAREDAANPKNETNVQIHPFEGLKEILSLTLAAVMEINTLTENITPQWQAEAPEATREKADNGHRKSQQELARQGFITERVVS